MKKIGVMVTALILTSAVWYNGCTPHQEAKDCLTNQGKPYNLSSEEQKVLEKIQKASQEAKKSISQTKIAVVSPSNSSNTYEYVGITHNNLLDTLASRFNTIIDPVIPVSFTLPDGTTITGNTTNEKFAVYGVKYSYAINNPISYNAVLNYIPYANRNIAPNNNYIDSMMTVLNNAGYTPFQTGILSIYFKTLIALNDNVNAGIAFSVVVEDIVNTSLLSVTTKEKILVCVTTTKYSAYYWQRDMENNGIWNQNSAYRINWWKTLTGAIADGIGAGFGCVVCTAFCPPCGAIGGGILSAAAWSI